MDLRNLNTFLQVAECGSFTKAGERLGYAQPTISVQIKQLEEELGVKLFDRIGHTIRLTDKGRHVLQHAQRICQMCQEMEMESSRQTELSGTVRLAMGDSLCSALINSRFPSFRKAYPNIALKVTPAGTDEMFRMLDHNDADIVCTLDSHIYNTNYVIAHEERVGVHFVASAANPLVQKRRCTVEELAAQPFLLTEKGMSYRRLVDERFARFSIEIQPILEMGHAQLICELVEGNVGISFLPDYVTEAAVRNGRLVRLEVEGFEMELWAQWLYHRDKWISAQMQAVIAHFVQKTLVMP